MAYEGWKNYPTWAVYRMLHDQQGVYQSLLQLVQDAEEGKESWSSVIDKLKEFAYEYKTHDGLSIYKELLDWTLGNVAWHEIINALLAKVRDGESTTE